MNSESIPSLDNAVRLYEAGKTDEYDKFARIIACGNVYKNIIPE